MVMKWFLVIQAILGVLFLVPCLWPVLSKYCICQIVQKGDDRYLYINRSPEWGGQLPKIMDDKGPCSAVAKSERYVTSYMILHVKSIAADWLPENIKSRVKKESKEIRKLKKCEDEYQSALRRHQEAIEARRRNRASKLTRFGEWCLGGLRSLFPAKSYEEVPQSENQAKRRRKISNRLRRTYSAIPAQEYEKEELINMHLLPATPQESEAKESTSMFNLR